MPAKSIACVSRYAASRRRLSPAARKMRAVPAKLARKWESSISGSGMKSPIHLMGDPIAGVDPEKRRMAPPTSVGKEKSDGRRAGSQLPKTRENHDVIARDTCLALPAVETADCTASRKV